MSNSTNSESELGIGLEALGSPKMTVNPKFLKKVLQARAMEGNSQAQPQGIAGQASPAPSRDPGTPKKNNS